MENIKTYSGKTTFDSAYAVTITWQDGHKVHMTSGRGMAGYWECIGYAKAYGDDEEHGAITKVEINRVIASGTM